MTRRVTRFTRPQLAQEIARQRAWIAEHGGSIAGYVARYGSADDPEHFGSGGEAIYAADYGRLAMLEDRLDRRPW